MSKKHKLRLAVIGGGRIGKLHTKHLCSRIEGVEVHAIADVKPEIAQAIAAEFQIPHAYTHYEAILENSAIDAIVVCSSTDTHAEIIHEAARAGKHIFCEKPVDVDLTRIESLLDAVEASGVKFQVGFNRRFDANFMKLKQLIAEGKIGDIQILRITSRDPAPPPPEYVQSSGGIFMDMTIHDFDMARYLVNSEVVELYATGGVLIDPLFEEAGDIDTAVVTLKFENGAIGVIDNSRKAVYGYDQRVEVFGSGGMVAAANRKADDHIYMSKNGVQSSLPLHFFMERYIESFVTEMQAFVDAVINDTAVAVTGFDGYQPVALALAARKSFEENRPVKPAEIAEPATTSADSREDGIA